jgi:hypothetical protein
VENRGAHRPGTIRWRTDVNRGIRDLLAYIVDHYATEDSERRIDLDANAELRGDAIEADKAAAVERERDTAGDLADAFERGLGLAWRQTRDGAGSITLDDRDPDQDAMASALISWLVRFELASSASRDLGGQHYAYEITVDWDRLRDVAAASGQRLDDLFDTRGGVA